MNYRVILASTSPRRIEIFTKSGIPFQAVAPQYEEDMSRPLLPEELARELSLGKAMAVAESDPDMLVIGADTFIVFGDRVLGKPHTPERARAMLRELSGSAHTILTGFAIVSLREGRRVQGTERTDVRFRTISEKEIEEYIATGEPLDRAGAYAIQGGAAKFVEKIDGDYENALGFPLARVLASLRDDFGLTIPQRN